MTAGTPFFAASIEGSYNELRDELSPRLSARASNVFDLGGGGELGIFGSISYFDRRLGSDGVENGDGLDTIGDTVFPVVIEPRDYVLTRERLGATLNIDYRVNEDSTLYVRQLYSRFGDDEMQRGTHQKQRQNQAGLNRPADQHQREQADVNGGGRHDSSQRSRKPGIAEKKCDLQLVM